MKKGQNIFRIILLLVLLIMSMNIEVYHKTIFNIILVFLIVLTFYRIARDEYLDKKFYFKWRKKRENGRLVNLVLEGLKAIIFVVFVVLAGQFIGNNNTPNFILSRLPSKAGIGILVFLLIFGAILGIVAWIENEKRYEKIYLHSDLIDKED